MNDPLIVQPGSVGPIFLRSQNAKREGYDVEEIRRVVQEAYIEGVHERQDEKMIRSGFHEEFRMYVNQEGSVVPVRVEEWLDRVAALKAKDPELWEKPTRAHFDTVDVSGDCAVAKLTVYKGTDYFSTDYVLMYRLDHGWMIVAKVFTTDPP